MTDYSKLSDAELSALVAEKLMEWEWWSFVGTSYLIPDYLATRFVGRPGLGWKQEELSETAILSEHFPGDYEHVKQPAFASDIDAAMQVLEAMRTRSFTIWLNASVDIWQIAFFCSQIRIAGEGITTTLHGLPRAICEAALNALEDKTMNGIQYVKTCPACEMGRPEGVPVPGPADLHSPNCSTATFAGTVENDHLAMNRQKDQITTAITHIGANLMPQYYPFFVPPRQFICV